MSQNREKSDDLDSIQTLGGQNHAAWLPVRGREIYFTKFASNEEFTRLRAGPRRAGQRRYRHKAIQEKPTNYCGTKAVDVLANVLVGKL